MCVFVGHGLRSTSFVLGVAKKSEVPICSATTSLTYPSSFCQAGTRTTAGDPWLCKLRRNKHELPVNTPSPNTHKLVLQISPLHSERRQYIFIYYWPLLYVCRFLYSLNKKVTGFYKRNKKTCSSCIVELYKLVGTFKNTRDVREALASGSCFSALLSCS